MKHWSPEEKMKLNLASGDAVIVSVAAASKYSNGSLQELSLLSTSEEIVSVHLEWKPSN